MAALRLPILDGGNRAIGFALLVSLALHMALLAMLPSLREAHQRKAEANPFHVRLVEARRPAAVGSIGSAEPQLAPAKPVAPQSQPKRSPSRPATAPAPVAPRVETSPPGLARTDPAEAEPATSAIAPPSVGVAPATASVAPATASVAALAPPAQETLDAGTLAQYLISIMSAARQFKRYPRVALDQNWQGRVDIRLVIAPNGEISALDVRSGTGHAVLDQHALEMIERAKAMVQIPPALRGREFTVEIPVIFSLREAGG